MRMALIGAGLIGGSAAAALRAAGCVSHVTGFDHDERALAQGLALGVLDRAAAGVAQAVADADLVLLAVPVGAMRAVLREVAAAAQARAIVTDVGSTKASVIAAARAELAPAIGPGFARFVPAHPIAGGELPGIEHADAALFRGRWLITTPVAESDAGALATVEALWRATGAEVTRMSADEHDRIFAAVSHLPHLLAFALVAQIAAAPDAQRMLGFAGAGFRDFTRIAASCPAMWRDIALANRSALSAALAGHRRLLDELQRALDAGDGEGLARVFELASRTKRALPRRVDDGE